MLKSMGSIMKQREKDENSACLLHTTDKTELSSPSLEDDSLFSGQEIAVIRKEFITLTGNLFQAVLLNQLLYWTQRVKDFTLYLEEERLSPLKGDEPHRHGWIYKTARELLEETMLGVSPATVRKHLKMLLEKGWIEERDNPQNKWDRTTQYRVKIRKLHKDLKVIGYKLPAFPTILLEDKCQETSPNSLIEKNTKKSALCKSLSSNLDSEASNEHIDPATPKNSSKTRAGKIVRSKGDQTPPRTPVSEDSRYGNSSLIYLTETTPKTTNREHTTRARGSKDNFLDFALSAWKRDVGQEVFLSEKGKLKFKTLLSQHFQNDLSQWDQFCKRVRDSPFLMGEGSRGWKVRLEWILSEKNLLKVLEGNFCVQS